MSSLSAWEAVELLFPTLHRWQRHGLPLVPEELAADVACLHGCRDALDRVWEGVVVPHCQRHGISVTIMAREGGGHATPE